EALGEGGEFGPFGALEGEQDFVEIAIAVFAAAKGGFDFGVDRKRTEDVANGFVEKGIADGEKPHEKQVGAFLVKAGRRGEFFAEIGAGERGANELGRLAGSHSDDSEDRNPAPEFALAEKHDGIADAVDFGAQAESGRIEVAQQAIEQGRLLLQKI